MLKLNLHGLLYSSNAQTDCFFSNISLSKSCKEDLLDARRSIREHLKKNLATKLAAKAPGATASGVKGASPRFFTQGSWAYKTINSPCQTPPQQADLDDGTYLPFSYIETKPPHEMSEILFASVEELLEEIAEEKKWQVCNKNNNCTRVIISYDKHIDVPVYSIPDEDFVTLTASLELAKSHVMAINESLESIFATDRDRAYAILESLDEQQWNDMPEGVLMATKDKGWVESDPRPIRDWVTEQVKTKGEQLRRVMRYMKAWRDHETWKIDDPKSILLMVAVDRAFQAAKPGRDDLALLDVLQKLPSILQGQVLNPATLDRPPEEQEDLALRLDKKCIRQDVVQRLERFYAELEVAVNNSPSPEHSCDILVKHLGQRVPYQPSRVGQDTVRSTTVEKTKAVAPIGQVHSA
ncbi:MAG: CBASS cGAMP synthase [Alcanivorax sp.]|tara:strand:- start:2725 stop:3954 length:1230 start_codon:yes stop_codon:yes gene_type:complete